MIIEGHAPSLEEQVFLSLEDEILSGEIAIGSVLTELSLAKRLGVSRTPIRGALQRLSDEGLIAITPNRGAAVLGVSEEDLVSAYLVRMRLEGLASRSAAEHISKEELKSLREAVELQEFYINKRDTEHLKELDTEFHYIIYKAAQNRPLFKILTDLHKSVKAYRKRSLSVPGRLEESVKEHREILEAIERGDADSADELTSRHVRCALDNILRSKE